MANLANADDKPDRRHPGARESIIVALEQLEAGDQAGAADSLLAALENGVLARRHRCPLCELSFEWPGLVDAHLLRDHYVGSEAA